MSKPAAILLLVGFISIFKVALVGVLTAGEILFIAAFPFMLINIIRYISKDPLLKKVFLLWLAYLVAQIISDLIRQTPAVDYQRGWAKIAILGLNLSMLVYISRQQLKTLIWYFWGSALGTLFLVVVLNGDIIGSWKFILGPSISILASLLLYQVNINKVYKGALYITLGILHVFLNCRSLGAITILSGFIFLLPEKYTSRVSVNQLFDAKYIGSIALMILTIYFSYTYSVTHGYLGDEAKDKHEQQTSNGKNVILGARSEIASSLMAISESPIIGHGSWAKDKELVHVFLEYYGVEEDSYGAQEMLTLGLIPTHSHLFGAWVEAGLFGFIFWAVMFRYAFLALLSYIRLKVIPYRLTYMFVLTIFLWDLLFSPFDTERRMSNAAILVLCYVAVTLPKHIKPIRIPKLQLQEQL